MALAVIARNGRSGQLIVKDERTDGTVVLFVCERLNGSPAAFVDAKSKADGRGPIPDPDTDEVLRALDFTASATFQFTVDTSGLPNGPQMFEADVFLARMLEALEDGLSTVELSLGNAPEWGFLSRGDEGWLA